MNTYQSLSAIAHNVKTSESELLDLERRSWIRRVGQEWERFSVWPRCIQSALILHLRRLQLTDDEIGRVLDAKEPPYSLADVPKVLGRPVPL